MMPTDFVSSWLRNVAGQLAVIPASEIEAHVRACEESLARAESFGCFTDPTAWMKAQDDGSMEDARRQLDIAKHLLAARKAIDARERVVAGRAEA